MNEVLRLQLWVQGVSNIRSFTMSEEDLELLITLDDPEVHRKKILSIISRLKIMSSIGC